MKFIDTLKSRVRLKKAYLILSGLMLLTSSSLEASKLPKPVDGPIPIEPPPPDPFLQYLIPVLDNHYQFPYYPGGNPDFLSQIYILSGFSISNIFSINPCDDRIMHLSAGQNLILDYTGTYGGFGGGTPALQYGTVGSNTYVTSNDRGRSWNYGPPIEQIIPLGGNISQVINASLGPGLNNSYNKRGELIASGWGFFDMTPASNADTTSTVPQSGFLFTTSKDNGQTFQTPFIDLASNVDFAWTPGRHGVGPREFYTTPQPWNPKHIYAASMFELEFPNFNPYSAIYFTSSDDDGKTFAPFREIYTMMDDPLWRSKYFNPNVNDGFYYYYGGSALAGSPPQQYDNDIVMISLSRSFIESFVAPDGTEFDADAALLRSLDNGKTWERVAGATEPFLRPRILFDPGFPDPLNGQIINGTLVRPLFVDFSAYGLLQISKSTGRVYLIYGATNQAISNPTTFVNNILVSSSADKGVTFSHPAKINQTPTNILPGAQQVFSPSTVLTGDGYFCLAYYDFRNWTGFPGEDIVNTPLQTDAWLDVYRETEDPHGGSTGIGLDFVGEIRLTPESFNARIINLATPVPYITPYLTGTPEGIPMVVNGNNELFVVYSIQSEEGVSPANITTGYQGATIDTNGYVKNFLKRFKFANPGNQ